MRRKLEDLVNGFDRDGFLIEIPTKEELKEISKVFMIENVRWLTQKYKNIILNRMFILLSCDYSKYKDKCMDNYKNNIIVNFEEYSILNKKEAIIVKNNILEYFKEYNITFERREMLFSNDSSHYRFSIPIEEVKELNKDNELKEE